MSKFVLDTDSVIGSSDVISKSATKFSKAGDSASGWNTENEDGFDFASAKSVIVKNLEECNKKALNTSEILNVVVDSHNYLQNAIVFDSSAVSAAAEKATSVVDPSIFKFADSKDVASPLDTSVKSDDSSSVVPSTPVVTTSSPTTTHSSSSSSSTKGSSGATQSSSSSSSTKSGVTQATFSSSAGTKSSSSSGSTKGSYKAKVTNKKDKEDTKVVAELEEVKPSESKEVVNEVETTIIDSVKDEVVDSVKTNHPINIDANVISVDGYSMIGNRFVVRCDSGIAKAGDVLKFTSADGNSMECIVGSNVDVIGVDKIGLIMDSDNKIVDNELTQFLNDDNTVIENLGNYKSVSLIEGGELVDA